MPQFSIIIPLYNKARFVATTIQSVLAQTVPDYEVIIINDGSTDNSGEIVRTFTDPRISIITTENRGVSAARNLGIEKAKAPWITFLDADDIWRKEFLEEFRAAINLFPAQKVFAGGFERRIGNKTKRPVYSFDGTATHQVLNYFSASMKESVIWTSCAVFHKDVFSEAGVFEEKLRSGQDTDLWIRIGLSFPVIFINKVLATYIEDASGLSRNMSLVAQKSDFSRFDEIAKTHRELKHFLDYNRFSIAINAKIAGDHRTFAKLREELRKARLSLKQKILLMLPGVILKILKTFR